MASSQTYSSSMGKIYERSFSTFSVINMCKPSVKGSTRSGCAVPQTYETATNLSYASCSGSVTKSYFGSNPERWTHFNKRMEHSPIGPYWCRSDEACPVVVCSERFAGGCIKVVKISCSPASCAAELSVYLALPISGSGGWITGGHSDDELPFCMMDRRSILNIGVER